MEYSSGILVYRKNKDFVIEFLMCSPSGPYWVRRKLFCFPKGHIELSDKTSKDAAIREFYEETSFNIKPYENDLCYEGEIKQNKNKIVSVYSFYDKNCIIDIDNLKCPSLTKIEFPKGSNKFIDIEEVSHYKWMTYDEIIKSEHIKAYESLYNSITKREK